MKILKTKPKKQVIEFVLSMKQLADANINHPNILQLYKWISDAFELIHYNEWGVALEHLLENSYEIDFKLDKKTLQSAKKAILACGMDYNKWKCIELSQ